MNFLKYFKKSEDKSRPNVVAGVITLLFLAAVAFWIAYDFFKIIFSQ